MNKKVSLGASIAMVILAIALTVSVTMVISTRIFDSRMGALAQRQTMFDYITRIDQIVREHNANIDEDKLRQALAAGYLAGINDPYAAFLTQEEYTAATAAEDGRGDDFGISWMQNQTGDYVIYYVQKNSPAGQQDKLMAGDIITALDGTPVADLGIAGIKAKMAGTDLHIDYLRGDTAGQVQLTSTVYQLTSVDSQLFGTVAYIRIRALNDLTMDQFRTAYTALQGQGATQLVLDLRGVSGMTAKATDAAKAILDYLAPRGPYAVSADTKTGASTLLSSTGAAELTAGQAVVLVDKGTGGPAELIAGVLQDKGVAKLVGVGTAGVGKVQDIFPIQSTDGAAIRLSVASLSIGANGNVPIEGIGLTPDYYLTLDAGQAPWLDLLPLDQDTQFQKALALLQGTPDSGTTPGNTNPSDTQATDTQNTTQGDTAPSDTQG